jgi:hypothetical protein
MSSKQVCFNRPSKEAPMRMSNEDGGRSGGWERQEATAQEPSIDWEIDTKRG